MMKDYYQCDWCGKRTEAKGIVYLRFRQPGSPSHAEHHYTVCLDCAEELCKRLDEKRD